MPTTREVPTARHAPEGAAPGRVRAWLRHEGRPLLLMLVLLTLARTSFANHYTVPSGSMEPTLVPGDHVVVDMSAYGVRVPFTDTVLLPRDAPARGDVVVFKSPADGERLIKRVVAVGGDTVSVLDGHVTINGQPLSTAQAPDLERFGARSAQLNLDAGGGPDVLALTLPPGQVLVMGDHRGRSLDGRFFGLVPARSLYARAVGVYWRSGEGPVWKKL
ncbi:signal peptidase I [Agrilutibacter solisilvae]|uniref:Signal peptidase I n=1 Tax=Agrilutibacter solisilvae TaxID=2763317 RepID=A0A975ASZ9_9GAMM|nr:signal peptidase I [Lysobacter solisilvae]QSX78490.1 signal peptidase I [Lysobacter solisilvae]